MPRPLQDPECIPVFIPTRQNPYGQKAHDRLSMLLTRGDVPHALLFTGIEGVGKRTAAMAFAMACNCSAMPDEKGSDAAGPVPCGKCVSCGKILSGNSPDIRLIEKTGTVIKIAGVRDVCRTLVMKPYEARTRVIVIADAQHMNPEAGNALLKVLEEPPARTVIILTALQTSDLLPTIVSRCQAVKFSPIRRRHLAAYLAESKGVSEDRAEIAAAMANGSFTRAASMAGDGKTNWIEKRNWLVRAGGLEQPENLCKRSVGSMLAFAEKLSGNKEELQDSLEIIKTWLRDLAVCKHAPGAIINRDRAESIDRASREISTDWILSKTAAVQAAQRALRSNANPRLALEVMMLKLAKSG